jgi:hypothetical protein
MGAMFVTLLQPLNWALYAEAVVYSPFGVSYQEILSLHWSCNLMFSTIFQSVENWVRCVVVKPVR